MRNFTQGFADTVRRHGCLAALHKYIYKIIQKLIVLDVSHLFVLPIENASSEQDGRLVFRPLEQEEIIEFSRSEKYELDEDMAQRLSAGLDVCFAVFVDGQLAGYDWLAMNSIEAAHNRGDSLESGVAMSFPEDAILSYNAFIAPDFREQGLYGKLVREASIWFNQNHGIDTLLTTTDWTNHSALRSCERQRFRSIGLIWRFGVKQWMFTLSPKRAAGLGIQFGDLARITAR